MGGKHHRHTRALLYCQCFRRGKKVDKGGSTKEKGARTLVVPELRALRHSGLDKGGGSGGGGILGPVASDGKPARPAKGGEAVRTTEKARPWEEMGQFPTHVPGVASQRHSPRTPHTLKGESWAGRAAAG